MLARVLHTIKSTRTGCFALCAPARGMRDIRLTQQDLRHLFDAELKAATRAMTLH